MRIAAKDDDLEFGFNQSFDEAASSIDNIVIRGAFVCPDFLMAAQCVLVECAQKRFQHFRWIGFA